MFTAPIGLYSPIPNSFNVYENMLLKLLLSFIKNEKPIMVKNIIYSQLKNAGIFLRILPRKNFSSISITA